MPKIKIRVSRFVGTPFFFKETVMTKTTAEIFEKYEVRKTNKQKKAFREWALKTGEEIGFNAQLEKCNFGGKNIIFGDIEKAEVIYGAHYDTCAVLPFPNFITPKSRLIYILYQLVITLALFIPLFILITVICSTELCYIAPLISYLYAIALLILLHFGPANRHTANDNSSGVTVIFNTMAKLPPEMRDKAAFVLFDLEEAGLIGSSGFNKKHKELMKTKPLVNFDCVSDGKNFIFIFRKKAKDYVDTMKKAFAEKDGYSCEFLTKGYVYASDQASFPCGIGVAAMNKKGNILYMDKIHTPKDRVYEEDNVEFLSACAVKLTEML